MYPFSTSILGMQIPDEFNVCYPPLVDLHLFEAFHRAKRICTASQESPILLSRPSTVGGIPSVEDLNPLPPSAGLRGYATRHHDLLGVKERELRRIQILQGQIKQASINVNRLMVDLQFVNGQVLAAQPDSWDCNLPQIPRDVDREDFSALPYANADEDESASMMTPITSDPRTATTRTTGSGTVPSPMLKCSRKEDKSMN